jgi:hypothetical protein
MVVRFEVWPGGDPRALRQIAILGIVNVGPEADGRHAYEARFAGRVTRLLHTRSDGALALVARAIDALAAGSQRDPSAIRLDDPDIALYGLRVPRDGAKSKSARRSKGDLADEGSG